MEKPLHTPHLLNTLQQLMRPDNIVHHKVVGIPKAEIDVRVRGQVEDGVDLAVYEAFEEVSVVEQVAVDEFEIRPR